MKFALKRFVLVLAIATLASFASAAEPDKRPITAQDLWAVKRVGAPALSPDGKQVAYSVQEWSIEKNKPTAALWLTDVASATTLRLTAGPGSDTAPAWSPDGSRIAFVGKRGEEVISTLDGFHAQFLWNNAFEETEMFTSFQIGLNAIHRTGEYDAAFLLPGDMPAVAPDVLNALLAEMEANAWDVVFPSTGARRLHPPLIHKRLFDALITYSGEDGLRGAFRARNANIGYVVTQEAGCLLDVDTPDDYARVQQYMKERPENRS